MTIKYLLAPALAISGFTCQARDLSGSWNGEIEPMPGARLSIVLNISPGSDGRDNVTLDSPDQGAYGLKTEVDYLSADSINVSIPALRLSYSGTLRRDHRGDCIDGIFRQATLSLPLVLYPGSKEPNRPQTPRPPFPYTTRDVSFGNPESGNILAGTLTLPASVNDDTPVVLMVSGSGLQDRDETVFAHKPFAVIADHLARVGIASLRYDDRGVGQSTGDGENATTADFASDAASALHYLKDTEKFKKTGILGHSEGGSIAFMLAADRKSAPDFIICMGAPAVSGDSILRAQISLTLQNEEEIEYAMEHIHTTKNPWMEYFLAYSPKADIMASECRTMALYGELDQQVTPQPNFSEMKRLRPDADVRLYPGLNHLMQHCQTGSVIEYRRIEETISPEVLSDIVRFILPSP